MKNGGLIENNRQNEPNKLPIFGAHQWGKWKCQSNMHNESILPE